MTVPPEAVTATLPLAERLVLQYGLPEEIDQDEVRAFAVAMLAAAAPLVAAAERDRLKAGPVSDCCGTTWSRVPAGGWSCAGCGHGCGLLGLLPARQVRAEPAP